MIYPITLWYFQSPRYAFKNAKGYGSRSVAKSDWPDGDAAFPELCSTVISREATSFCSVSFEPPNTTQTGLLLLDPTSALCRHRGVG